MKDSRVAVVTGSVRGIGAATAVRLAADGFTVAVLDLEESATKARVDTILGAGGRAIGVGCDVSDAKQVGGAAHRQRARPTHGAGQQRMSSVRQPHLQDE